MRHVTTTTTGRIATLAILTLAVGVLLVGAAGGVSAQTTSEANDTATAPLQYDVSGDGTVNIVDTQALFTRVTGDTPVENPERFDFNRDGDLSIADVQAHFNIVDTLQFDVNADGEQDITDVQALFIRVMNGDIENPERFDFNRDGEVDIVDVQTLFRIVA